MLHPKMCIDKPEIPKPRLVCYYFGTIYVSITDSYKLCHKMVIDQYVMKK